MKTTNKVFSKHFVLILKLIKFSLDSTTDSLENVSKDNSEQSSSENKSDKSMSIL